MLSGFVFSLIVSVLFAVYAAPRKFSRQNVILYTMWMGIAYFMGALMLVAIVWGFGFEKPENLLNTWHFITVLRGFVWVIGMAAYNTAIDKIGLTRFNQWKNAQGPVGSLLILFIVDDWAAGIKALWLLSGMAVMFCSALLFQIKTDTASGNQVVDDRLTATVEALPQRNTASGISFALLSGVCFGISAFLNSIVSRPAIVGDTFTFTQLLYHSASLIVFSALVYMVTGNKSGESPTAKQRFYDMITVDRKTWLPFIAGAMYMVATLLTIYAYRMIPNAVAWSITQLNVFWTVLLGIFIFKEVNWKRHWLRLTAGVAMAAGSSVLLFIAI